MLNDSQKRDIVQALVERIKRPIICPICHGEDFAILDGYLTQKVKGELGEKESFLPSIAMICTKCGFISQHNIGILGLIKDEH